MAETLRVLSVLGQRPALTGSGVLVKELWQSGIKRGDQNWLICGSYSEDNWADWFRSCYSSITFTNNTSQGQLPFPIPGMSDVMPYNSVMYGELSDAEVQSFINAYSEKVDRAVAEFKPDIIHLHHLWVLTELLQAITQIPFVVTVHGTDLKLAKTASQHRPLVARNLHRIHHFLCVSNDMAQDAWTEYGIEKKRTTVIGNGYNPYIFSVTGPRQEHPGKVIMCAGKFVSWKGFRFVIRACAQVSTKCQLVILGTGTETERVKLLDEAKRLSVKVAFPGHVSHSEVAKWMRRADVFVLPSVHEPFGLVLLEALACGCRTIASGSGGPKDIITTELIQQGLATLVNPLSSSTPDDESRYTDDFASAIQSHLQSETTIGHRNFIAKSVGEMTWDTVYEKIRERYVSVIFAQN